MRRVGALSLALCAVAATTSLASRGWWAVPTLGIVISWFVVWQRYLVHQVPPWAIIFTGVALRIAWIVLVPTEPAVDFAGYHAFAEGLANGTSTDLAFLRLRLHEVGYPLFLSGVYQVLGATAEVGRATNVLLALWLLVVMRRLLEPQGEFVTRTGLMVMALWPGHVALSSLLASENLFLPLLWSGVALVMRRPLVGGLVLGAAQAVRPPALMMIALVAWSLRRRWREAMLVLVGVALAFGAYRVVRLVSGDTTARGGIAYSLLMGTNVGSGGAWNFADHQSYDLDRALSGADEANRIARSKSLHRLTAASFGLVPFMVRKFLAQWGNAAVTFTFAMTSPGPGWLALADAWAVLVWVLGWWRVRSAGELTPLEGWALMALAGTCVSHLLLEANPRYALPWVIGGVLLAAAALPVRRTP